MRNNMQSSKPPTSLKLRGTSKNQNVHEILENIIERKKVDLIEKKNNLPLTFNSSPKGRGGNNDKFKAAIAKNAISIIAEVKLASPTEGELGTEENMLERVITYEKAGADAISIITEPHYFHGSISFIPKVKEVIGLPTLQKDFVIDEYQIYESKMIGADALLLIARLVDKATLQQFVSLCFELGIEPVVEIANEEDLSNALSTQTRIIAVNARDLTTFAVSIETACALLQRIPKGFISLGFSGIHSSEEVKKYKAVGVRGVLVGTELMERNNIEEFIPSLKS